MVSAGDVHVVVLAFATVITGGLASYAWRHRTEPGAPQLAAAMVAVTAWSTTEMFAVTETAGSHLFWEHVQWGPIAVVPIFFFLFMADFTGYGWVLSRRYLPVFFAIPIATIGLIWTNDAHSLMYSGYAVYESGGIVNIDLNFGPWFWLYFVYAYSLLFIGFALLLRLVAASDYLYLDQTVLVVVGILAPLVGNAVSVFDMAPLPALDLTPIGFTVTGIAFGNALFRYRLFELLPATRRLGRQAALVNLNDGIVIVDTEEQVLYMNPEASEILDCDAEAAIGEPAESLVASHALDFATTDRLAELTLGGRTYEVETAPITDRRGKQVGHTILLYDVTERTRREEELRAQRDRYQRLERINTVIREVNQALVSATTIEDLERTVVETLATPGLYDEVWLNTTASEGPPLHMCADDDGPTPAESGMRPGAVADRDADGSAASPTAADSNGSDPEPSSDDPAARTGTGKGSSHESMPASVDVEPDSPVASEQEPTVKSDGAGDWATVALVYGRTVYGVLALHTDRADGFGERELEVLDELGETIGHALTAIERTHLLVADTRIEIDVRSGDERDLLVALARETDVDWVLDGLVPATEGDLLAYLSTDAGGEDAAASGEALARDHPGVSDVRRLATDGGTTLEVRSSSGMLAHPLVESGANVRSARTTDGNSLLTFEMASDAAVRTVLERVRETFPDTELMAKREVEPVDQEALPADADMTDRQREALEAAYRAGYFDWPRDSTAEDVADSLDIASATLHGHLRKAEHQLLEAFFEE